MGMDRAARQDARDRLLAANGWSEAQASRLAGDASFRHYERLTKSGQSSILMDAPPETEDIGPFCRVAELLARLGLSAPRILARDASAGFLLLEDLGDLTFTRALASGHDEAALYSLAVDALAALHARVMPDALCRLPGFDDERAVREVALLLDWYWPGVFGTHAPAAVRAEFEAAWREVLPARRSVPDTLVLFDFHVDNLMVLPERSGVAACGLLDFQDALAGPLPFDLVSLLEDVRRTVAPNLAAAMIERYLQAQHGIDRAAFLTSYAVLGAQRNTRIAGTFARLLRRDGKSGYQRYMARVWQLIEQDLRAPVLAPVAGWFERHLPAAARMTLSASAPVPDRASTHP